MESLASTPGIESRLLLEAAAVAAPASGAAASGHGLSPTWERLVERAIQQRCAPLLCRRLRSAGDGVPPAAAQALERLYLQNLLRTEGIFRQLGEAAGALQAAGIPVMALKGVYLARSVYADSALRPMVDIDLMVPPTAVCRLAEVLAPLGYRMAGDPAQSRWDAWWKEHELCKFSAPGRRSLEIHTTLGSRAWPPAQKVWERSGVLEIEGAAVHVPSPNDLLVHLIKHLVHHLDASRPVYLIWLADVARVLAQFEGRLDPAMLNEAFRRLKIEGYAALMLQFCRDLLGAPDCGLRALGIADRGVRIADWTERTQSDSSLSVNPHSAIRTPRSEAPRSAIDWLAHLTTAGPEEVGAWRMDPTAAARSRWRRRGLAASVAWAAGQLFPSPSALAGRSAEASALVPLAQHYGRLLSAARRHVVWQTREASNCGLRIADCGLPDGEFEGAGFRAPNPHSALRNPQSEVLEALEGRLLASGEVVRLPAVGESMMPTICPGDVLVVAPVGARGISVGDIVVWRDGERLIAHRVVRSFSQEGRRVFQTQGDARWRADPVVPAHQALGRVLAIERLGTGPSVLRQRRLVGVARALALRGMSGARAVVRCLRPRPAPFRAPVDAREIIPARGLEGR